MRGQPSPNLAFLDIGGVRLMLAGPEGDFKPGLSSVLYCHAPECHYPAD